MQRSDLINYFRRVRQTTEDICQPLEIEDHVIQPITDVSPPKWHLGHTSWFYEAIFLDKHIDNYQPYHPQYAYVFNSYYESLGVRVDRNHRGYLSRPTVKEALQYRGYITDRMCELIESVDEAKWPEFSKLLVLAANHEQQHQELLVTDIKYILAVNPLLPGYLEESPAAVKSRSGQLPNTEFLHFEGGDYDIGYQGEEFYYDNERPVHKVRLDDFKLQNRLITNREYLEFIEDGGYKDFRYWLSDAWETVRTEGWKAPLYWRKIDGDWYEFTMSGLQKLNPEAPLCHVSYYEADAFAQWANKRLPTEAEWEVAARLSGVESDGANFFDTQNLHPVPLSTATGQSKQNLHQMLGDVWEWTGSAYLPYPGYRKAEGPLGEYNGKFMVNQMVLRGGCCATPRDHIRLSYRNFFYPDACWPFAGFCLARTTA